MKRTLRGDGMKPAYYNENNPIAAQWLRNLISKGHIAPGDVDERSIEDVLPSDLVGIRPIAIGPEHIGHRIGQFCSWEIKHPTWTYSGTEREVAQSNWIRMVTALGGDAKFLTGAAL